MKIYLAGTTVSNPDEEEQLQQLFLSGHKLHSYYHCKDGFERDWFLINMENKTQLFLDSGAFSAWSQGAKIDIYDYITFIKQHLDVINVYANLDVIGNAKETLNNQRIMEREGLKPLPIFHFGEPEKYLQLYLTKYDYIGLGGMVPISTKDLSRWLDRLFTQYLCDPKGYPKVKIHGFGLTSLPLLLRYPWYSIDSTSWVVAGRLGSIYMPRFVGNRWVYDEQSWKIAVSSRSPNMKDAGKHFTTLPPRHRQLVLDYLEHKGYKLGESEFKKVPQHYELKDNERWAEKKPGDKTERRLVEIIREPGVSNKYQLRDEVNIIYFLDLEKSMPEWPWPFKIKNTRKGFF